MPNLTCVVLLPPPISTIWSVLASGADTWNGHNVKPLFHWLSKDSRSRDLSCNLRKSFKHKGENGRVSILLVRARLHPHPLGLSPDWSFISTTSYFCLNFKTCQQPRWLLLRRHQSDGSFHHQLWRPQQFWSCKIMGRVIRWATKYAQATRKGGFYLCPSAIVCTL